MVPATYSVLSNTETSLYVPFYVMLALCIWSQTALEPRIYVTAFDTNWQGNLVFLAPKLLQFG